MQRILTLSLAALVCGMLLAPAAAAQRLAEGDLLLVQLDDGDTGGISENIWAATGDHTFDGLDGVPVNLPSGSAGKTIWANGTTPLLAGEPYELDLFFYDAQGHYMNVWCFGNGDAKCTVPAGAAFAWLDNSFGPDVHYTVEVA